MSKTRAELELRIKELLASEEALIERIHMLERELADARDVNSQEPARALSAPKSQFMMDADPHTIDIGPLRHPSPEDLSGFFIPTTSHHVLHLDANHNSGE